MDLRRTFCTCVIAVGVLGSGMVIAQGPPEQNINPSKHPNLAAAQRLIGQAFDKITAAQQANEFDLEGHAAKAKELLDQASKELKEAAEAANRHHH